MQISGAMLKDRWPVEKGRLYGGTKDSIFFSAVRMLDENVQKLEDHTLYVQCENTKIDCGNNALAGILCLEKPQKEQKTQLFWTDRAWTSVQLLNQLLEILQSCEIWYNELQQCLRKEEPLQKAVDYLYRTLGNPCYMADMRFRVLAMNRSNPDLFLYSLHWKQIGELGYLPYDVVSSVIDNPEWEKIRTARRPVLTSTREFSTPFLTCNLRRQGRLQSQLFLCEIEKKITQADADMVQLAAGLLEEQMQRLAAHEHVKGEYYEYVFRDVLSGKIQNSVFMDKQLAPLKWKAAGMFCLLEIEKQEQETYAYERFASNCSEQLLGRPVLYKDRWMAVFYLPSAADFPELKEKVRTFLQEQKYTGALSDVYTGFLKLAEAVHWTKAVLERKRAEAEAVSLGTLWLCRDFLMEVLVSHPAWADHGIYRGLDIVRSLKSYDRLHHSEYAHTLEVFLGEQSNLVRASKALHIHRNTLVYRLEKLQEMLPESLEDAQYRFLLQVTFGVENVQGRQRADKVSEENSITS